MSEECSRYPVVFEPGDPPRAGRIVFWSPDGGPVPEPAGEPGELTVVVPQAGTLRARTVPARRLPVAAALPVLVAARRAFAAGPPADPAAGFWGAAALLALHLVARGRVAPGDLGGWRADPREPADEERVRALAAAAPPYARAVPLAGRWPPELPEAEPLLRAFLDAVADTLVEDAEAGEAAEVRVSLRIETGPDPADPDRAPVLRAVVQVHSRTDPAQLTDARDLWRTPGRFPRSARAGTLLAVRLAGQVWPPLEQLLHTVVPDAMVLADEEVTELLTGAAARLRAAGVELHWPRELARDLTATVVLGGTGAPPSDVPGFFAGGGFELDWRLALGGQPLTAAERDRLAEAHRPVVRLRDRWVLVDPALAGRVAAATGATAPPRLTAIDALGAALTGTVQLDGAPVEVAATGWLERLRAALAEPETARAVPQPPALAGTLRDYQLRGLQWLARLTSLGLGGCLADDMGLGKTITLIALHLHRQADPATAGATLVVCPASLVGNWQREVTRFAPRVPVHRFHGAGRSLDPPADGFVITTYTTMRQDPGALSGHRWGLLVADEAQHVKNPTSATARALRRLPARARVALTGTPVENHLAELWAILDWTTPGLLGTRGQFRNRWAGPVESGHDPAAAQRLARLVGPFLLRRRKSDPGIAPELPRKTETDQPVALTAEQAGLYEAAVRETMLQIGDSDGIQRQGLVLKLLTALKQICNHPAQYLAEPGTGRLAGRSGKLELLDELLDTILAEDGAVLVFTQYVAMARLIARHLADRDTPALLLHGGTPVAQREQLVSRFQRGEAPVFLLSLKAAGTGLNLTRADHVIHYDRWWNPAVEEQATDRAYRIGQTRPVQVHRLIAEGTVEDRIAGLLASKRALADAVLGAGVAGLTELSDAELRELVELRGAG
ncbi:MAG: ATP-dependent helicase [Micromonosporaceae bacterium]|nr:ATP-dependent helicase [Micromonosporaceae bacterium]